MSMFTVTPQGVITVDTGDIRADFETAYREALGADLDVKTGTPQGNMIVNDTATLTRAQAEVVNIANSFSPYYTTGHALDVSGAFWGYFRKSAQATTVVATLSGQAGTIVPAGSIASDGTYDYKSLDTAVIGENGTTTVQFSCTVPGPIPCPPNTLTTMVTQISGWESVNNSFNGVLGFDTEPDNVFRARITANWLNVRGRSILGAIVDNIAALNGVVSVVGRENPSNTQNTIDGVVMPPHSIYLAILGGQGTDIAQTIAAQKTLGAATVGNTEITFTDDVINYNYVYRIQRPNTLPIGVQIKYAANNYTGADIDQQIRDTVMAYIANNPFKIGQVVSGNILAQALNGFNQIDLLSFKVRSGTTGDYVDFIDTTISQIPNLSSADIVIEEVSHV